MLKSGDVIVTFEAKLRELAIGMPLGDVRQGKAQVRKMIEDADDALGELVVVRVEKVGRPKARKPAFDCAFDDEIGEGGDAA